MSKRVLVNDRVAQAMRHVDRRYFIDCDEYKDMPGKHSGINVTAPHMHAIALGALVPSIAEGEGEGIVCVDLGCGTGYVAAVMRTLFDKARVIAVDHSSTLPIAQECIRNANIADIEWTSSSEWNDIIKAEMFRMDYCHVGFGVPVDVMHLLSSKLSPIGRIVLPVGSKGTEQELLLVSQNNSISRIMSCVYEFQSNDQTVTVGDSTSTEELELVEIEIKNWQRAYVENNNGKRPSLSEMPLDLLEKYKKMKLKR
jgi:protein-L-isoaspartate O-methyltransferase